MRDTAGQGIRIHPDHFRLRKQGMQFLLDQLGTRADKTQLSMTVRAFSADLLRITAVMAHKPVRYAVERQ